MGCLKHIHLIMLRFYFETSCMLTFGNNMRFIIKKLIGDVNKWARIYTIYHYRNFDIIQ